MTNEEARAWLEHHFDSLPDGTKQSEAVSLAIKALEREQSGDLISRDMALEKMADYVASGYADSVEDFEEYSRIICQLPSVNPQESKTGHWINQDEGAFYPIECSECHKEPLLDSYGDYVFSNYCPVCGAKMIEPQESIVNKSQSLVKDLVKESEVVNGEL